MDGEESKALAESQDGRLGVRGHALSGEHIFNDANDALLPAARQLADFLENLPHATRRATWLARRAVAANEVIERNAEDLGNLCQHFGADGYGPQFKITNHLLADT